MTRLLALAAVLSLASPASLATAAPCPVMGLSPKVLAKPGVTIPSDGGIVVAAESSHGPDDARAAGGEVADQKGWRFRVRRALVAPAAIDIIAPGLAVYRLPAKAETTELENDAHTVVAKFTVSKDARPRLSAPNIKQVQYQVSRAGRRTSTSVTAELAGAAPADAVALVIADANGKPRSWGSVQGGTSIYLYSSGGCGTKPNGTEISNAGDKVTLFWVDSAGRTSPPTKPLTVTGTGTGDGPIAP